MIWSFTSGRLRPSLLRAKKKSRTNQLNPELTEEGIKKVWTIVAKMHGIEKDYDRDTANEMLNQSGFGICDKATCFYALCFQKNKHINRLMLLEEDHS
jgi:hypothetical protein